MVRAAVVQHPPVFLDRAATLDKAVAAVEEAAGAGARLVVLPEAYVPGYPAWIWRLRPGTDMALAEELHAALAIQAVDLSLPEAASAVVDATVARFGRIDLLVNNAGATPRGDFLTHTDADWQAGFALKFFGAMRLSRAAWPHLRAFAGSIVNIAAVAVIGAFAFGSIGLLVGSRARTFEAASGLMNATTVPMWVLSGVFFSSSNFPEAVQPVIQALPLTALVDAMRGVILEGATLAGVWDEIAILSVWTLVPFAIALRIFKWR